MAKQAKIKQTDYTTGGRDISNTAIPMYQENLGRVNQYLSDPTAEIDKYLNKYYTNTSNESDFLRSYNRAMSDQTGRNYNATQGGYSSLNQQNYDDLQRYQNDLASRLRDYGVGTSAGLAQNYYNSLLQGNQSFQNAYGLGADYSNIDQYNDLVDQSKNNWIGSAINSLGDAGVSSGVPWAMAVGAGLKAGSNFVGRDTGNAMNTVMARMGAKGGATQSNDNWGDTASALTSSLQSFFGKKDGNTSNSATSSSGNPWGLNTTQPTSGFKFSWQK